MGEFIVGSESLAAGSVTRQDLRARYLKIHQNVYAPTGYRPTADDRAIAAWLWSGRRATLVGYSAAALLGSRWLPDHAPAELGRLRQPAPRGIVIHSGAIAADELIEIDEMRCTTAPRTGYDMGRRLPFETGVIRIDALLNATGCSVENVVEIADRYPGHRGIRRLRVALEFADPGAESPQETRLRLLIMTSALPRPETQIPVGRRRIDMGWPAWMVGVEYDGDQHWSDSRQHAEDIERLEFLAAQGWTIVRVSRDQLRYRPAEVIARIRRALQAAGAPV